MSQMLIKWIDYFMRIDTTRFNEVQELRNDAMIAIRIITNLQWDNCTSILLFHSVFTVKRTLVRVTYTHSF